MPPAMNFHRNSTAGRNTPRGGTSSSEVDQLRAENAELRSRLEALSGVGKSGGNADKLREQLISAQRTVEEVQDALRRQLVAAPATSRAGHLRTLLELIGPPPDRTWADEWVKLKAESYRLSGQGEATVEEDEAYVREHDPIDKYVASGHVSQDIDYLVQQEWPEDRAKGYTLLFSCLNALGRALRQRDPCYAASTYALSEALFAQRQGADKGKDCVRRRQLSHTVYAHLHGLFGLVERDPEWERLEIPDGTGFRGLTSSTLVHATCDPRYFTEEGFSVVTANPDNPEEALLQPQDSDIVCFVSLPDDEHGAHSAIVTMDASGDFPPNTLFRLRTVYGPGQWEAPGGVFPHQRLLEVTATYQPPRAGVAALDSGGSKMCGSVVTLGYNKREAFLKGLDDLLAKPVIAMAHEFSRGFKWKDWRGIEYTDKDEFAYVKGPAVKKTGCTPGTRDENNNGKTPQQFADAANDFIRSRRDKGFGTMLTEDHAYLTLDEVYAVRLYTGPAYQPINTFLRQIASLTSNFRNQVAQHPGLTYAATVGHICRAIRKLSAVATKEEATAPLWRGVRGDLERSFWETDDQDMICAVDMAFMSTSKLRKPPIDYMDGNGSNVLWQLYPTEETDSGFHRGADVDLLSQFAGEAECLFPPCTMLVVKEDPKIAAAKRAGDHSRVSKLTKERRMSLGDPSSGTAPPELGRKISMDDAADKAWQAAYCVKEDTENGKNFLSIDVLPTFL